MILRKSNDRSRDIDLGPSPVVGPSWLRGVIVVGEPSKPSKGAGLTPNQMKPDTRPVKAVGKPRESDDVELKGRGRKYATEEERIAARRQAWRDAQAKRSAESKRAAERAYRERKRAA